ncbi:MAG: sigma-70 family RNA polymerase sigma factor [Williamsia sp.]|nr:sigma-70 family RNA polymerase sigma factor [Williamsia sp.]
MATERNHSDQELTEGIRSGQNYEAMIRHLYQKNYPGVHAYIIRNSGSDQDAQDIFQEVIVTFIELVKQQKFRGESAVSTFLLALTRNIWLNELKKRGRSQLREEKFEKNKSREEGDISRFIFHRELRSQLMGLLDTLGIACKTLLLAYYYENLSMREIFPLLQYENEQVARNKKYKCLKQLEQVLASKPELAGNIKSILLYE